MSTPAPGRSKEGLQPGDVIFFHVEKKDATNVHRAVRTANSLNARHTGPNHSAVHTEIVTGIDRDGLALVTGIGRSEIDYPNREARTRTLQQAIELRHPQNFSISVGRPTDPGFARKSAEQALSYVGKKITYSTTSCLVAFSPTRAGSKPSTANAPEMMCAELVINALREAAPELKLKSRIPPGAFRASLDASSKFIVSNPKVTVEDGVIMAPFTSDIGRVSPPVDAGISPHVDSGRASPPVDAGRISPPPPSTIQDPDSPPQSPQLLKSLPSDSSTHDSQDLDSPLQPPPSPPSLLPPSIDSEDWDLPPPPPPPSLLPLPTLTLYKSRSETLRGTMVNFINVFRNKLEDLVDKYPKFKQTNNILLQDGTKSFDDVLSLVKEAKNEPGFSGLEKDDLKALKKIISITYATEKEGINTRPITKKWGELVKLEKEIDLELKSRSSPSPGSS